MSHANDQFTELTLKLKEQYVDLDQVVDEMLDSSDINIDEIGDRIRSIKRTEQSLAPMRLKFKQENATVPPYLRDPTDQTIKVVTALMPKLAQLEQKAIDAAKSLFPKIQEGVRAVQMQKAYGSANRAS